MTAPVAGWMSALCDASGWSRGAIATAILVLALVPLPLAATLGCAALGRALSGSAAGMRELFCRLALALVPLGASMWAAHLVFHLATGGGALLPVVQRAASDLGVHALGAPSWAMAAPPSGQTWLLPALLLIVDAGLLLTLWVTWRMTTSGTIAMPRAATRSVRPAALLLPCGGLACALWIAAIWILLQPMEMRGAMLHG
jgi:hypothetical protein